MLNTASPTIWGRPQIVTLEERVVMANSSMVASTIPKSLIYHGNKDAYIPQKKFAPSWIFDYDVKPGLFTNRGCCRYEASAHEAVLVYRDWGATK